MDKRNVDSSIDWTIKTFEVSGKEENLLIMCLKPLLEFCRVAYVPAVVGTCIAFLERVVELWQKWPVDLQNRLQAMVLPEGVGYDVLEGVSNPRLSLVYAAIADSATMAAPRGIEPWLTD